MPDADMSMLLGRVTRALAWIDCTVGSQDEWKIAVLGVVECHAEGCRVPCKESSAHLQRW